ncbi:hypothetical protein D061_04556 [Streptococcus pneumoniae 1488]|nr:hypothetical protein D061_04556 [Streptococcus pneumoniae 1488]
MTRQKNALRGHFVAPYNGGTEPSTEDTWLELAKWISDVSDDTDEKTDDQAYYDGDGVEETTVVSVKGAYTFEGTYDPDDKAQALIAGMKYKTGDDRKLWHKVVSSDRKNNGWELQLQQKSKQVLALPLTMRRLDVSFLTTQRQKRLVLGNSF